MSDDKHQFIVTVDGCTHDQAHEVMRERLGFDEDYGFAYGLDWEEYSAPGFWSQDANQATAEALRIESISSAGFQRRENGTITGVAYDSSTDIEFDVVRHDGGWYVSDDDGHKHHGDTLQSALQAGIAANTPGGTT